MVTDIGLVTAWTGDAPTKGTAETTATVAIAAKAVLRRAGLRIEAPPRIAATWEMQGPPGPERDPNAAPEATGEWFDRKSEYFQVYACWNLV
jgi:hypothetical protein